MFALIATLGGLLGAGFVACSKRMALFRARRLAGAKRRFIEASDRARRVWDTRLQQCLVLPNDRDKPFGTSHLTFGRPTHFAPGMRLRTSRTVLGCTYCTAVGDF